MKRARKSSPKTAKGAPVALSGHGAKRSGLLVSLGIAITVGPDGQLPTEARIFKAGWNETEKGPYLFDDKAAELVMAHQASMGSVDRMIDLEHLSLDEQGPNYDPDARGWCRLAVRNGELWLVGITWTPDGSERLTSRKQRYLSPAFPPPDEDGRVTAIVNIALTALPATHDAPALIAANARGRKTTMHPKLIALHVRLALLQKLAADAPADAAPGKAAAAKAALEKCMAACAETEKAFGGSDIDAVFASVDATLAAMDECETALRALAGGNAPPDTDGGAGGEGDATMGARSGDQPDGTAMMRALGKDDARSALAEVQRLRAVALEHEKTVATLAAEKKVLEDGERRQLVGTLVKLGHELPATAWSDDAGTKPAEPWASMKLETLRARVEALTGTKPIPGNVSPPAPSGEISQTSEINIDENELNRLRATIAREKKGNPKGQFHDEQRVIENYAKIRLSQLNGARESGKPEDLRRFARGLRAVDVLTSPRGELVKLATAVQPIQEFGATSQRALEEFRLEYNSTLVSLPIAWSEDLGVLLPGGGLKDTYPLGFYAVKFREKTAQNAAATTPNSADVTVQKKQFFASAMAELRRIVKGDFAYVQQWGQTAAQTARARVNLRNHLITDLLEGEAVTGKWGTTKDQPNGIDGQAFFSASHKVNPFDPKMKAHSSATWGNYAATAYPLNAASLTAVKALFLFVPGPDGEEMGARATGILNPTTLDETARLLLTVQDLILDANASLKGVSDVFGGGVRNEHFQSGFEHVWAPQLAGTDGTADYYLYSREIIGRGLPPWVLAEDAAEEVRVWDENSEFYKNGSGFIKTETNVFCNAALLYPHGIRLVKGS